MTPDFPNLAEYAKRQMPSDHDAEKAVVGVAMQNPDWLRQRLVDLPVTLFWHQDTRTMFEACVDQLVCEEPLDAVLLTNRLRATGKLEQVGGPAAVMESFMASTSPNIGEPYIRLLRDLLTQRQHIEAYAKSLAMIYDAKVHEPGMMAGVLDVAKGIVHEAGHLKGGRLNRITLNEAVKLAVDEIEEIISNPGKLPGKTTGFKSLDQHMKGLRPGRVTVCAGMPSDGKSTLMQNIGMAACRAGAKIGVYGLEMPAVEQAGRILAEESGISANAFFEGKMTREQQQGLMDAMRKLKNYGADIIECESASASDIIADIEASRYDVVLVDYLQLIEEPNARKNDNRETILASISRRLKKVAVRTGTHILTASQLNDNGKLRESRAIGQDADTVLMIEKVPLSYEPGRLEEPAYGTEDEFDDSRRIIHCAKNRGGARGWKVPFHFLGATFTFREIEL